MDGTVTTTDVTETLESYEGRPVTDLVIDSLDEFAVDRALLCGNCGNPAYLSDPLGQWA